MATPQPTVIDILTQDHQEVEALFMQLEALPPAESGKIKELTDQAITELVKHSVAEESEVYPAVARKVSDKEADKARHEHAETEQIMKRLDALSPADPEFFTELTTLIREVRAHVVEEEQQIFPGMREHFTEAELIDLGEKVQRVKGMAPTRPHPAAPDTPPANKLLGPATGLFDRMRDAFSKRGNR